MRKLHNREGGFTLIELMIVVAIIGILAAIAIPNFLMFQLRSKTGEAKTNLAAIRTAEEGYFAEFGGYVGTLTQPPVVNPRSQKQPWVTGTNFDQLGWAPEGQVFFLYNVATAGAAYSVGTTGDLDANATVSNYGYIHPIPGGAGIGAALGACVAAGVFDPAIGGPGLLNTVGPCTNLDGQINF